MGTCGKINAIWWNIKINLQKLVDICGYELPINLQNFTQNDLTEVKIFLKVLGGYFFKNTLYIYTVLLHGAADLDERQLKTCHSKQGCAFWGENDVPLNFWQSLTYRQQCRGAALFYSCCACGSCVLHVQNGGAVWWLLS